MKKIYTLIFTLFLLLMMDNRISIAQEPGDSPQGWAIVASYTIPGKASGLAWDGTYIYFGIYGVNGDKIYKFNPSNGTNVLQCTGTFGDAYGLTYKSPNLVTIDQPSNSTVPANALEFSLAGSTISTLPLPNHYMSGIAWDNGSWWVCTYYPDPGTIYNLSTSGSIISQFAPPSSQPWDICKQGSDLWIADYYANSLYKVTTTGTLIESHASAGQNPAGIVYDGTYLWYCDGPLGGNSTLYKVDLTGTGTPVINIPQNSHNYGAVTIGTFSTWNCQVQNTGTANLSITDVTIPAGQPITTTFSTPQTITPGNSLNIPFKYTPTASVIMNTQVTIHSSDPIHPTKTVTLMGVGVYPGAHILLQNTSHNFNTRRAGAYSRWYLPVTNDGNQDLVISALDIDDEHFIIDESITLPLTIPTLTTKDIGVWFHPTEGADYNGILSIATNSLTQGTVNFDLSGVGEEADYPIGTPLWIYRISGGFDNSPKSIMPGPDITGDGVADIIIGSEDNFIRCFNGNASVDGDVLWEKEIPSGSVYQQNCISMIDDMDGDDVSDVIIGSAWGDESIIALSGKTGMQLWKHDTHEYGDGGWVYQVDSKYDYNSDGFPDVLAATGDDGNDTGPVRVYCLNGLNGNSIWEKEIGGPVFSVIGVQDFTGDLKPDVVAGASNSQETVGRVYGIDGASSSVKWSYITPGSSVWGLMQLDDINGDGKKDIAAGDFEGNILFLSGANGSKLDELSIGNVLILRFVDIGDNNQDGFRDILVGHSGTNAMIINGKTCATIWSKPLADKSWCVANIGDVTFDGISDPIVGTLYQDNYAYFLHGKDGSVLFSYPSAEAVDALNAIPDIVGDTTMELLFGDRNGLLTCLSGGLDTNQVNVGIHLPDAISLKLYPNPSDGAFNLDITSIGQTNASLFVVSPEGKIVHTQPEWKLEAGLNHFRIELKSQLVQGIYALELRTGKGLIREKLVIKE
jgi:hypothetical protein